MAGGIGRADRRRQAVSTADLTAALEHHRAGRLDRAEALYRKFLQKSPGHADALHLLGMVALTRGNAEQAIRLIGMALKQAPGFVQAHSNLGLALRAAGRLEESCASFRQAITLQPDFAPAHSNLGLALCELGDLAGAVASCRRAIALDPRSAEAQANLGNALRRAGQEDAAEAALRQAATLNPENAELQLYLADLLLERRCFAAAAACYRRAIELDPGRISARHGLANALRASGAIEAAIVEYRAALALDANQAPIWNDLGRCFLALGRFDEAVESFRRALALDPELADAYRNLASCRGIAAEDPAMVRLTALATQADLPVEQRAAAGFALGLMLDEADRHDDAFAAYDAANRLYRVARAEAGDRFDAAELARRVDRTIEQFTPTAFSGMTGWGNSSALPVFIVGMPRSGTSLVEQIAASHSGVFGAGELRSIGEAAAALGAVESWTPSLVRKVADTQLDRLRALDGTAERIVDKLPDNIFLLGVIAALFPAARVVFCRRDPRDIGLSCYFQKFSAGSLTFSYDLADCGRRIRETERLARHWHRVLPLRWLDVEYEALIADPETESRRLIDFLGLDWQPACLDFHRTDRIVQTASSWQVRQPLYSRSVGRWRAYVNHLTPLLDALTDFHLPAS